MAATSSCSSSNSSGSSDDDDRETLINDELDTSTETVQVGGEIDANQEAHVRRVALSPETQPAPKRRRTVFPGSPGGQAARHLQHPYETPVRMPPEVLGFVNTSAFESSFFSITRDTTWWPVYNLQMKMLFIDMVEAELAGKARPGPHGTPMEIDFVKTLLNARRAGDTSKAEAIMSYLHPYAPKRAIVTEVAECYFDMCYGLVKFSKFRS
jgi:hypothetical protein